jgi:hypothetical protein
MTSENVKSRCLNKLKLMKEVSFRIIQAQKCIARNTAITLRMRAGTGQNREKKNENSDKKKTNNVSL